MNSERGSDPRRPKYPIGSVDNALKLLEMFGSSRSVRVADVRRHLEVAPSTAHRLLQVLQASGYVEQERPSGPYFPGPSLIQLAASVIRGLDLRTVARPVMEELVKVLDETVHVSVLHGAEIFFLESIETTRSLRVGARTGMSLPAHATAAGRVLLASLPHERLIELYPGRALPQRTSRTISGWSTFEALLDEVRTSGYATSYGESEDDVASVAVPIFGSQGRAKAALAVAAPPARLPVENVETVAHTLTGAAARISAALPT